MKSAYIVTVFEFLIACSTGLRVEHGLLEQLAIDAPLGREIDKHGFAFVHGNLLQPLQRERLPGFVGRCDREAGTSRR